MIPTTFLETPATEIVHYPDPVLMQECATIEDLTPWTKIAPIMVDLMVKNKGLGLAAPQVGLPYRMFVLGTAKESLAIINPKIIKFDKRTDKFEEGCLSLPGVHVSIERSRQIKATWTTLAGKNVTATFAGWTARAFQHEIDHTFGSLITRRKAVWHTGGVDIPVLVTGSLGIGPDKKEYFAIDGSSSGIPADQLKFSNIF
jgi:peptide deformylase